MYLILEIRFRQTGYLYFKLIKSRYFIIFFIVFSGCKFALKMRKYVYSHYLVNPQLNNFILKALKQPNIDLTPSILLVGSRAIKMLPPPPKKSTYIGLAQLLKVYYFSYYYLYPICAYYSIILYSLFFIYSLFFLYFMVSRDIFR